MRRKSRRLGVHVSIAGGIQKSMLRAEELGCTCAQIFTHSPRMWGLGRLSAGDAAEFKALKESLDICPVFSHASYLINVASPDAALRRKSVDMLRKEMLRADALGLEYVVIHTGTAHDPEGLKRAAKSIKRALRGNGFSSGLLLENTSGKRGDTSSLLGELAFLLDACGADAAGVCIDSCHAFAAGYDFRSEEGLSMFSYEARRLIGEDSIRLIHLNDSKGESGSGVDRHEHIGMGAIGFKALRMFLNQPPFHNAPVILESPKEDEDDDGNNLRRVRRMI